MPGMTKKMHEAGIKAAKTRRIRKAWQTAHAAERESKRVLVAYCQERGWRVAFFEGPTGAPRTGIIDAIAYRLGRGDPDKMDMRLIQLKGGKAGITGEEIRRLKDATRKVTVKYLIAEFDEKRDRLQLLPDELEEVSDDEREAQLQGQHRVVKARRV
jgi:hypothetical protein